MSCDNMNAKERGITTSVFNHWHLFAIRIRVCITITDMGNVCVLTILNYLHNSVPSFSVNTGLVRAVDLNGHPSVGRRIEYQFELGS